MKHNRVFISLIAIISLFLLTRPAAPAKAFWLGVPESLKALWQSVQAQEGGGQIAPTPPPAPATGFAPSPTPPPPSGEMFGQQPGGQTTPPPPGGTPGMVPGTEKGSGEFSQPPNNMTRDFQREGYKMERDINQFDRLIKDGEKSGLPTTPETRQRVERVRGNIDQMKRAESPEDMRNINLDQVGGDMANLEQERMDKERQQREQRDLQRGVKDMGRGVQMFESQVSRLIKRGTTVPPAITENLSKIKTIIAAVKSAKNFEEAQEAGLDDIQDLMQDLNESRMQLEMLSRWPQTQKDMDRQLSQLKRELKKAKSTVDRLAKKGIDLLSVYAKFEEAINKLQAVRDEAVAKIKSGEAEDAMEMVQDDFFGQMEDVWEGKRIIDTMSNLGRFTSEFKRGIATAEQEIRRLARRKIPTDDLKEILAESKAKGQAILDMLKSGDIDEEEVMSNLQELEDLRQQFEEKARDLTGEEETMPWEQGPRQFSEIKMAPTVQKFIKPREIKGCAPGTVCDNQGGVDQRGDVREMSPTTAIAP